MKLLVAAALGLTGILSAHAIEVISVRGVARDRSSIKGTIVKIDQRSVTIEWMGGVSKTLHHHQYSYQQAYQLTSLTAYRDCSWASLAKGVNVCIWGHGLTADAVQINPSMP